MINALNIGQENEAVVMTLMMALAERDQLKWLERTNKFLFLQKVSLASLLKKL